MALSWPTAPALSSPSAARPARPVSTPASAPAAGPAARVTAGARSLATAAGNVVPAGVREFVTNPVTGLVAVLLGLVLLFTLPMVGLVVTAVVSVPAVVYHLRSEHRVKLRF